MLHVLVLSGNTVMITAFQQTFRGQVLLGLASLLWIVGLAAAQGTPERAQTILHMLDYVAVDYPEFVQDGTVLDQAEYNEQVAFSQQVRTMLNQLPAHSDKPGLLRQAEQLIARIQDKRPGPEVAALAHRLRWDIIRAYNVEVAPKRPPDLRPADQAVYIGWIIHTPAAGRRATVSDSYIIKGGRSWRTV